MVVVACLGEAAEHEVVGAGDGRAGEEQAEAGLPQLAHRRAALVARPRRAEGRHRRLAREHQPQQRPEVVVAATSTC